MKQDQVHDLPIGFTMALSRSEEAMRQYTSLPEEQRQEILAHARQIHSREEMHAFVHSLFP